MTGEIGGGGGQKPTAAASSGLDDASKPQVPEAEVITPAPTNAEDSKASRLTSFADFHHGYVGQYIQFADAKAGATFALTTGITAFLLNSPEFSSALRLGGPWLVSALAIGAFALLNLSSILSFFVIVPRLPTGGDGLIFWKPVADLPSGADYAGRIASLSADALAAERVSHSYNLSVVCTRKYNLLRRAMVIAGLAVIITFFYWLNAPDVPPVVANP